jgi:fatty acid synthase, animal type
LKAIICQDLIKGVIKPLPRIIYKANEIEKAMKKLARGEYFEKIVIQVRENSSDLKCLPITVYPRVYCNPNHSYVMPGGLGGFGLELADWLVLRGCRKLVLSSSRGITNQYQAYRIRLVSNSDCYLLT